MPESLYWKIWWDKGIMWLALLNSGQVIGMNSYQAQELFVILGEEKERIDDQAILDEKEFGRDHD